MVCLCADICLFKLCRCFQVINIDVIDPEFMLKIYLKVEVMSVTQTGGTIFFICKLV